MTCPCCTLEQVNPIWKYRGTHYCNGCFIKFIEKDVSNAVTGN